MNPERKEILALPSLPGRLTPAETAWRLGFEPDHIPILVNLGLLYHFSLTTGNMSQAVAFA